MFYIDIDLKSAKTYIFPFTQPKDHPYVISFKQRYEADIVLRKLTSGQYKAPPAVETFERVGLTSLGELSFNEYQLITR